MGSESMRTVVEENNFVDELNRLAEIYPNVLDRRDAVIWLLSRKPYVGTPIQRGSSYRVFELPPMGGVPALAVLYLYDEEADADHVHLYGIHVAG